MIHENYNNHADCTNISEIIILPLINFMIPRFNVYLSTFSEYEYHEINIDAGITFCNCRYWYD
jgi:hypothetical protein